jgi:hypothetical protein
VKDTCANGDECLVGEDLCKECKRNSQQRPPGRRVLNERKGRGRTHDKTNAAPCQRIKALGWSSTALLIIALSSGCADIDPHSLGQTIDNWNTERQMYEIEALNGLPMHHGHLADGSPYEQ